MLQTFSIELKVLRTLVCEHAGYFCLVTSSNPKKSLRKKVMYVVVVVMSHNKGIQDRLTTNMRRAAGKKHT